MTHPAFTRRVVTLALGLAAALSAHAQATPPIRILVGFAAGGGVDTTARVIAESMSQTLSQTVVVENRPGAGGLIAAQALKAAPADGTTLMLTNDHTVAILPHTLKNPGFSTTKDFTPVARVSELVFGLAAAADTQVTSVKDIATWARRNPGRTNFGTPAPGSMPEFAASLISKTLGVDGVPAAYRGGAPMVADLTAGQIPFGLTSTFELLPFHKSQKIRILAVSGPARRPELAEVPTFDELGIKELALPNILGLYAPSGTPPAVVTRYSEAVRAALASEKVKERLQATGTVVSYGAPEALAQGMQHISDTWAPIIRQSGFQPQ